VGIVFRDMTRKWMIIGIHQNSSSMVGLLFRGASMSSSRRRGASDEVNIVVFCSGPEHNFGITWLVIGVQHYSRKGINDKPTLIAVHGVIHIPFSEKFLYNGSKHWACGCQMLNVNAVESMQ
jgi:hypothetical protein